MACLLRVKIRKDVLDALKPSLTEVPHKTVASHIVWRLKVATVGSLSQAQRTRSSAQAITLHGKGQVKSSTWSIKTFHRNGESTLPCGHPSSISTVICTPRPERLAFRFRRKLCSNLTKYSEQPFLRRPLKMAGGQVESNALLISKKTHEVKRRFLKLFSTRVTSAEAADSVDLPARKPNWHSLNQFSDDAAFLSREWINLSNSLARTQRILIGLKLPVSSQEGLLSLRRIITTAMRLFEGNQGSTKQRGKH